MAIFLTKFMKKREAYNTWLYTQDPKDWDIYTKKRNQSKSLFRKADSEYQKQVAREVKTLVIRRSSGFWSFQHP